LKQKQQVKKEKRSHFTGIHKKNPNRSTGTLIVTITRENPSGGNVGAIQTTGTPCLVLATKESKIDVIF
jgi:hypothetical protein